MDSENIGINKKLYSINNISKNFSQYRKIDVPSCWNSISELKKYEGYFWYFNIFEISEFDDDNQDFFLLFNGINYFVKIWLNGNYIGSHEGGFLPFKFKIKKDNIKQSENNYLAIQVENIRKKDRIPSKLFDWYNWAGIYRDAFYEIIPKNRIKWVHIITELNDHSVNLKISYNLTCVKSFEYYIAFNRETIITGRIQPEHKKGIFNVIIEDPNLWSPDHPNLYLIQLDLDNGTHIYKENFGIRVIETRGQYLYFNKKIIKLYGVNLHEELMPYGRAIPYETRKRDLENIKTLGFNSIRSAHYSHDESLLKLADKIGLLILEEIPVYWNVNYRQSKVLKIASKMIHDLIFRDFNHPSVIFWSVGNEVPIESIQCNRFILLLVKYAKKLDPSRLVSYVSSHFLSDHYRKRTDIATLNEYFGWYLFRVRNLNFVLELTRGLSRCFNKPWFITEFGAGAKKGFNSKTLEKFSEERQASIINRSIEIFNNKKWIAGWFIWIYRDFKSALRTNQYQQGFNRKGIVSEKNEPKLIAKLMPKIIKRSIPTRSFEVLSKLLMPIGFFFSYFFKIIDFVNILQEKAMDKYYITKK